MTLERGLRTDRYEHIKLVDFLNLARTLAAYDIGEPPVVRSQTIDKHAHLWETASRDAIARARASANA